MAARRRSSSDDILISRDSLDGSSSDSDINFTSLQSAQRPSDEVDFTSSQPAQEPFHKESEARADTTIPALSRTLLPTHKYYKIRPAKTYTNNYTSHSVTFEWLNEGAANVVFRIRPCQLQNTPSFVFIRPGGKVVPRAEMLGKVLRISKGKPKTLRARHIIVGFEREIKPLFRPRVAGDKSSEELISLPDGRRLDTTAMYPSTSFEEHLMEHEFVGLDKAALQMLVQTQYGSGDLSNSDGLEEWGILLPDMSSQPGRSLTLEFKPKWLANTPNTTRSTYRCRTCALHAKRIADARELLALPYLCPLQLMAGNKPLIEDMVRSKLRRSCHEERYIDVVTARAVEYLTVGPGAALLKHLRHLQANLDPLGICTLEGPLAEEDTHIHRLRLAMTLRDCSLLLRIPYADTASVPPIEAKLVDLDFKSRDKLKDWCKKESTLRNGGWYTDLDRGVQDCYVAQGWATHVPRYM